MKKFPQAIAVALFTLASVAQAHSSEGPKPSVLPLGLDPTHLHLLTNHIPIFITLAGLIALGLAMIWKSDTAKRIALVLLIIGTVGGIATYWLGQQAYKPVRGLADETGQDWLDLHMERAEQVIWLFWMAAISAVAALVMVWRKIRFALLATFLAGSLAVAALAASGWIADAGGKIRHPEIRGNSLPVMEDSTTESVPHEH
jgi:hypothetical protein